MGWFGTLLATCGCVGSYSLKCSTICYSWGYSIRLHAAVQLLYLMLLLGLSIRFRDAIFAATRSDATFYMAIWLSISIPPARSSATFYVAARHSIRLCAEILLAQTRIPLCSLRCCILFSGWGFLLRFVLREKRLLAQRHFSGLCSLGFLPGFGLPYPTPLAQMHILQCSLRCSIPCGDQAFYLVSCCYASCLSRRPSFVFLPGAWTFFQASCC